MVSLLDGEEISKISLFVLAQLTNVMDGQTDRHRVTSMVTAYTALMHMHRAVKLLTVYGKHIIHSKREKKQPVLPGAVKILSVCHSLIVLKLLNVSSIFILKWHLHASFLIHIAEFRQDHLFLRRQIKDI